MSLTASSFELACKNLDICNRDVEDGVIAGRIKKTCPSGVYSWLLVRSVDHQFIQVPTQTSVPSRMIEFQPTSFEAVGNILSIIFRRTEIETLSLTQLSLGILGSKNPQDQAEVRSAFWQNYRIKLFIATDGTYNYDILPEQGKVTEFVATTIGKQKKPEEASQEVAVVAPASSGRCVIL